MDYFGYHINCEKNANYATESQWVLPSRFRARMAMFGLMLKSDPACFSVVG